MSNRNGAKPPEKAVERAARLKVGGGIGEEATAFLERRTRAFQKATGGRGQPITYGTGKKAEK